MIDEARLRKATADALMPHMGVAAEFVAEDAVEQFSSAKAYDKLPDEARLRVFFIGLAGLIDKTLSADNIRQQILKNYGGPR